MSQRDSDEIRLGVTAMARQAAHKALAGPKTHEDALHHAINADLDELEARNDLTKGR